ncbi:MAG: T9SS type A sorting domain-containing protein, partial [Bacteroidota bacterium]
VATEDSSVAALCNGDANGSASVAATGGTMPYAYDWPSGTTSANDSNLAAGTYVVTVTDANGCVDTATVVVTEPTALALNVTGNDVNCEGGSDGDATADATGGTGPYNYLWDDPVSQTTQTASGLAAGTFNVTVTDDNGCTINGSTTITFTNTLPTVSVTADADSVCKDSMIILDAGAGFSAYAWSNGGTAQTNTVTESGTYMVTVTDGNGCENTDSITVVLTGICVGIEEVFANAQIRYYPNPTDGILNMEVNGLEGEDLVITVMNIHGQVVFEAQQRNLGEQYLRQIDLSGEAQGIYFVRLTSQGASHVDRISVK